VGVGSNVWIVVYGVVVMVVMDVVAIVVPLWWEDVRVSPGSTGEPGDFFPGEAMSRLAIRDA
jgi:hypothetical protein